MKTRIVLMIIQGLSFTLLAQESTENGMEKRAREMHRVIGLSDPAQWKKFIKENCTQAWIDRPMKRKVQTSEDGTATTTVEPKAANNLEAKTKMFQQLHEDFGQSKITSIKTAGENLQMVFSTDSGLTGALTLKFDKTKSYLIDGLGIEIQN